MRQKHTEPSKLSIAVGLIERKTMRCRSGAQLVGNLPKCKEVAYSLSVSVRSLALVRIDGDVEMAGEPHIKLPRWLRVVHPCPIQPWQTASVRLIPQVQRT